MADREKNGTFATGNKVWAVQDRVGVPLKFTPETFLKGVNDYYEWATANPIVKTVNINTKEGVVKADEEYARPFTKTAMCVFMGITRKEFDNYKKKIDNIPKYLSDKGREEELQKYKDDAVRFNHICTRAEEVNFSQKFEGASVGLFNAAIMIRDLSLVNKEENTLKVEQPLFPDRFKKIDNE